MKTKREDEGEERRLKDEATKRNQFKLHDIEFLLIKTRKKLLLHLQKKARKQRIQHVKNVLR